VAEHLASLGRASLAKRLAAIGQYHRLANQPFSSTHPVIHHTLRGIHRAHGRPARRAAALATAEIKRLVAAWRRCTRMRCGRSSGGAPRRPGSRPPGWSGCRRTGCGPYGAKLLSESPVKKLGL
jgi:hypothetical protein